MRQGADLKVKEKSTRRVIVANGHINRGEHTVDLPFDRLSPQAREGDTFTNFHESLMSVGKVNDDGNVSIFTKDDVTVYNEEDVLITCKGTPILVGTRDNNGRYRIPLDQSRQGQWRPLVPSKSECLRLYQANSVYDLPSTEQSNGCMPSADTPSNPPGSKQSKQATS